RAGRRRLIGPGAARAVYRLPCDVESDVRRVEGLLAAGRVRAAAEAYAGPLLPASDAPGVVREREHLDAWLRQAVMTAEDADALWAWVHTPSGEDDLGAWKRLLAQLEFRARAAVGVPRRGGRVGRGPRGRAACSADVTRGWSTEPAWSSPALDPTAG